MSEGYDDLDDAIKAAIDMLEPGRTLRVHEKYCDPKKCSCTPRTWTNPLD